MKIKKYSIEYKSAWDSFVDDSKNSTFLFNRVFIEYHKERFEDFSLLVLDDNDAILALLPANISEGVLHSHQGLTYGGLLLKKGEKLNAVIRYVKELLMYLFNNDIFIINIKQIPRFYHKFPSDEMDYICFLLEAKKYRVDLSLTIELDNHLKIQTRRMRMIKKAKKNNLIIREDSSCNLFWSEILEPNLMKRFNVSPVHSISEIEYLRIAFPDKIKQYSIYKDEEILAGTTLFIKGDTVHAQYISASIEGRKSGAIDLLFYELIEKFKTDYKYFDFGICNENQGKVINHGLLDWKEGFGGRSFEHGFYRIETSNYTKLESVIND